MKIKFCHLLQALMVALLSFTALSPQSHSQCTHLSAARNVAGVDACLKSFAGANLPEGTTTYEKFMSGRTDPISETKTISYRLPDHTFITIVNLAKVQAYSVEYLAARNYLLHRDLIYKQRIKKFKAEDVNSAFLRFKIDQEVRLRSFFVMNTEEPISEIPPTEFLGGARVSISTQAKDKLPFELGLSINRPRKDRTAAEIGALTATTKDNPYKSVEIINAAIKLAADYAKADDVYVHTSAVHARMYHRMNIVPEDTLAVDDLNHILEFDGSKWRGDQLITKPATH